LAEPVVRVPCSVWRASGYATGERAIPEETAVAFTYNTASYAVMMATPQDLEDFAVGFSLTEGVISSVDAIESVESVEEEIGIELRIWLKTPDAAEFLTRRRKMAGPTGCGLCGIESLTEAMRPPPGVHEGLSVTPAEIMTAIESLFPLQALNRETRAVHGAGFFDPARGLVAVREDVGRHNALDKLSGALARASIVASEGIVLLTSRVSVEMVQKTAAIGAPVMVSVSAPTALAVRMADAAGITLAAIIAAIAGLVYYFSTQKLQRQLVRMRQQEALEKERARIARDLHDQLGANLTQVSLLGELVESDKDSPKEVEALGQQNVSTSVGQLAAPIGDVVAGQVAARVTCRDRRVETCAGQHGHASLNFFDRRRVMQ
jgi:FdhD protein